MENNIREEGAAVLNKNKRLESVLRFNIRQRSPVPEISQITEPKKKIKTARTGLVIMFIMWTTVVLIILVVLYKLLKYTN